VATFAGMNQVIYLITKNSARLNAQEFSAKAVNGLLCAYFFFSVQISADDIDCFRCFYTNGTRKFTLLSVLVLHCPS
jgi:hypothetical protein